MLATGYIKREATTAALAAYQLELPAFMPSLPYDHIDGDQQRHRLGKARQPHDKTSGMSRVC